MKNKFTASLTFVLSILMLTLLSTSTVLADKNGRSGATITGCTCHDQGTNTTVNITGVSAGSTIYMRPNETRSFSAVVAHSTLTKAGIDVSVKNSNDQNVGTLNSGTGTKRLNNEIVHNGLQTMTNSQFAFGFSWTAPSSTGTYTFRAAACAGNNNNNASGDEWNSMTAITIIVANPSITLTNPNGGQLVCKNSKLLISWSSIAIPGNIRIELTSNNGSSWVTLTTVPASSNFFEYDVTAAQASTTSYKVRVSDALAASTNDVSDATFSVLTIPVIITQPKPDSVCTGGSVTFSVVTDNMPGYTYQWRRNTVPIQGATTNSYSITNAQQANVADYDVVVTGCTPVTSSMAFFQLNTPPAIVSQQNDTSVCKGSPVILSCNATGTTLSYQWKRNGTVISGATSASLSIAAVNAADTGNYTVTVSGKCPNPQTSNPINLRFTTAPVFVNQPRDTTVCLGETIQFTAIVGGNDITYQWRKEGKNIDNAVGNSFAVIHISDAEAGNYDVIAKNSCNLTTTSSVAVLKTRETTVITSQPRDTSVQAGISVGFTVGVTGSSLKYQWQKNGTNRPADTLPTITFSSAKVSDTGSYKCIIKTPCGNLESAVAKLKVTAPPAGAALALSTTMIDFGCVNIHTGKSLDTTITNVIKNVGGSLLNIESVKLTGSNTNSFQFVGGSPSPFSIAPNEAKSIVLSFLPSAKGTYNAELEFTSNTTTTSPKLALEGKGCAGEIKSFNVNMGIAEISQSPKDTVISICNTGNFDLFVSKVSFKNNIQGNFTLSDLVPAPPLLLQPGKCITTKVLFTPVMQGKVNADLIIETDQGNFTISLEGEGKEITDVNEFNALSGGVSVSPNPSSGNVVFSGSVQSPMPIKLHIFDALGSSIYHTIVTVANAGEYSFAWDATQNGTLVSNGYYTAMIAFGAKTECIPFVIAR
ncbi:MAG: immunoglobulin domain-containing protein [Ignavibacteriae bacterium]|nr:immunoglobulin domain-containing protein [Ignavibacteriota bacterium]